MQRSPLVALVFFLFQTAGAQNFSITSPTGLIRLEVSKATTLTYSLTYKGKKVITPSCLGFRLNKPAATLSQFTLLRADTTTYDETWNPVWGEVRTIRNHYKELTLSLKDQSPAGLQLTVVFRVFDDGLGFRYEFPAQATKYLIVAEEQTQFALSGDHKTFWIPGDYDSNEYLYNTTPLSAIDAVAAS